MAWQEVTDPEEIAAAMAMLAGKGGAAAPDPGVAPLQDRLVRQSLGIPVLRPELDPYAQIKDPKQREMARRAAMGIGEKEIAKDSDQVDSARNAIGLLTEFEGLNEKGISGGFGGWLASKAPAFLQSPETQRMEQITATIAPMNRIAGTGAVSDFDAKQLVKQTGGVQLDPKTNRTWTQAAKAAQQAKIDMQAFREAYLQANGTLTGANRMWQEYANAERIFDKNGSIRPGRKTWSEYFATRAQNALAGKPPTPKRVPVSQTTLPKPTPARKAPAKAARVVNFNDLPE